MCIDEHWVGSVMENVLSKHSWNTIEIEIFHFNRINRISSHAMDCFIVDIIFRNSQQKYCINNNSMTYFQFYLRLIKWPVVVYYTIPATNNLYYNL